MNGLQFLAHNNMLMSHVCAVLLAGIIDHSVRPPACSLASAIKALKDGSFIEALSKANYWMASNAAIGKVGFSRDLVIMRENRPALHARVEKIIMGVEK